MKIIKEGTRNLVEEKKRVIPSEILIGCTYSPSTVSNIPCPRM